jgi:ABC-type antimicrobial peptide transport system permease subunit
MALGALPAHVLVMMLRECLLLVSLGIAAGIAATYGADRLVASMLFGVSPLDPLTYCAVAAGLTAVALIASLAPARRASRIDPVVALKTD